MAGPTKGSRGAGRSGSTGHYHPVRKAGRAVRADSYVEGVRVVGGGRSLTVAALWSALWRTLPYGRGSVVGSVENAPLRSRLCYVNSAEGLPNDRNGLDASSGRESI